MLKKLKKRFVLAAILALTAVIGIIITAINIFNYASVISSADDTLNILSDNSGRFPMKPGEKLDPKFDINITPETPYELRYFTVNFLEGKISSVDTASIAAVDYEEAIQMARRVVTLKEDRGFMGNYRFLVTEKETLISIIFLDCTRRLDSAKTFLFLSVSISCFAIGVVFLLLNIIAERIVKPISDSYHKQKSFITNAGHDIKTPITIIDADAELIEMELGENEWLTDIKKQTTRLASLTNDLIYLSRMEEIDDKPHIDFPLSDVAEEVINSFASLARTKNIEIKASVPPAIFYFGEEESIRKLFTLLLDNAIKYSPEGEKITFEVKKHGRGLEIKISNAAPNLEDETVRHMFDRFYRSDKSRNSDGGFGIGLSVANAIVSSHKGRISAEKDGDILVISIIL